MVSLAKKTREIFKVIPWFLQDWMKFNLSRIESIKFLANWKLILIMFVLHRVFFRSRSTYVKKNWLLLFVYLKGVLIFWSSWGSYVFLYFLENDMELPKHIPIENDLDTEKDYTYSNTLKWYTQSWKKWLTTKDIWNNFICFLSNFFMEYRIIT